MMTTTKMILASALLALTTSPATAQSLRRAPATQQSPSAVQLIQKAQAAAEAGDTQKAQKLMANASAMLTAQADAAAERAARAAVELEAVRQAEHALRRAAEEQRYAGSRSIEFQEPIAGVPAHDHPAAKETAEGHFRLRLEGSQPQAGMVIARNAQEPEAANRSPLRGSLMVAPSPHGPSRGFSAPHEGLPSGAPAMQGRPEFSRRAQVRTRSGVPQQGNGMEELLRGIHQELRGIRQELSGIRESLGGGQAQGGNHGHDSGHAQSTQGPTMIWTEPQVPTGEWLQMGVDGTAAPQQGVFYLNSPSGEHGESVQYRVLSPQGGDYSEVIHGRYEGGQIIMLPTDMGAIQVDTLHENGEIELQLHDMELLEAEMQTLNIDMRTLGVDVPAGAPVELETLIELGYVSEETPHGLTSPQVRVRVVPAAEPVPAAQPLPPVDPVQIRRRVRIVEPSPAEDPDVQPEDPFFRPAQPTTEPTPAKPVITSAGVLDC